jgi:hypothetical protein
MKGVGTAYRRALRAQFSRRMLVLSGAPLILSLLLWGAVLWTGLQPLLDWLQGVFSDYGLFQSSGSWLSTLGLGVFKVMVVPLLAIALLLPLMIGSALLFMGVIAMPAIERHVGNRQYPKLEKKEGGSFIGSVAINLGSTAVFALLWLLTLPLYAVPPLAWLVQACLWAWVTSRVMSYDALAADLHALHAFVPAADHVAGAQRELERVVAVLARIELGALAAVVVAQPAGVVDGDVLAGFRLGAAAGDGVFVLQAGISGNGGHGFPCCSS